jgi:hypothetical protein
MLRIGRREADITNRVRTYRPGLGDRVLGAFVGKLLLGEVWNPKALQEPAGFLCDLRIEVVR